MELNYQFGKKLKEIRKSKNMTQQQFAELVELEPTTIGLIETGKRAISFKTLERLATKLNIPYFEFFYFGYDDNNNSHLIKSITNELNKLDNKSLKLTLAIMKLITSTNNNSRQN